MIGQISVCQKEMVPKFTLCQNLKCVREDSSLGHFSKTPTPSSRNVKLQNNPLIVVSITMSKTNGPGPKHAPRIILTNGDEG